MTQPPLIEREDIASLGPIRLLYVPSGDDGPQGVRHVPIAAWIAQAKHGRSGLDDSAYWHDAIVRLGLGSDAMTVVMDDGRMTEAARVWFILQYFGLPAVVLNGGAPAWDRLPAQSPDHAGPAD